MWTEKNNLIVFLGENYVYHKQVCILSFLMMTAMDIKKIRETLRQVHRSSISIVVIENEHDRAPSEIKEEVAVFRDVVGDLPLMMFFSTKRDFLKKPQTNIWREVCAMFEAQRVTINIDESLCVGSSAGRAISKTKPADPSCCDRAFAFNIGMDFVTSERFFLAARRGRRWKWNRDIPSIAERKILSQRQWVNPLTHIEKIHNNVILFVGPPVSGKSRWCEFMRLAFAKYDIPATIIDTNDIGAILESLCEGAESTKNLVIGTSADRAHIVQMMEIVPTKDVYVFCIKASRRDCLLLDQYRLQTTPGAVETKKDKIDRWLRAGIGDLSSVRADLTNMTTKRIDLPFVLYLSPEMLYQY